MTTASSRKEYAKKIARLGENEFEDEVCALLQQTYSGFQRVPRKPDGDGGIDGLSHSLSRAYCCYGPDLQPSPATDAKTLRKKVVGKFQGDLRRILEVDGPGTSHKRNEVLEGVLLPPKKKLMTVYLVTNWFETNRLIGDLNKSFETYCQKSKKRFITGDCELVIWGPRDLATAGSINELSLLRVEHPVLIAALAASRAAAPAHVPDELDDFNEKFDALLKLRPDATEEVNDLRETFRRAWSSSILFNEQLSNAVPHVHRALELARSNAATEAKMASLRQGVDPFQLIPSNRDRLRGMLEELPAGALLSQELDGIAEAETGRLIGECPLEWRKSE